MFVNITRDWQKAVSKPFDNRQLHQPDSKKFIAGISQNIIIFVIAPKKTFMPYTMKYKSDIKDIESIAGTWTGKVSQVLFGKNIEFDIKLDLQEDDCKVVGKAVLDVSNLQVKDESGNPLEPATLSITGAFYENRFLHLNYKNQDEPLQFGFIVIDLFENIIKPEQMMKGLFIGYGPKSKKVINGEVVLRKTQTPNPSF